MNIKKYKTLIYILFIILMNSCNSKSKQVKVVRDTIIIRDTIEYFQVTKKENYLKNRDIWLENYKKAYYLVKETPFNKNFFKTLKEKNVSVNWFIVGMIYEEQIINEAVILFYMKYYRAMLTGGDIFPYHILNGFNKSPFIPVFFLCFTKMSSYTAVLPGYVYKWVLNNPKYLENKDIALEVEKIKRIDNNK